MTVDYTLKIVNRRRFTQLITTGTLPMGISTLSDLEKLAKLLQSTDRMPALFVGHGNPMNAIEDNEFTRGFSSFAKNLSSTPQAILCVSAHWYTEGTRVLAVEQPETIHDFGGFPRELFEVEYPAPGHPKMAAEVVELLGRDTVEEDHQWGLDHGTWSVLTHMFPEANIPVFQLSIDHTKGAEYHFELAVQLASLRDKGVLIVGSGNIVHNLRQIDWQAESGFDWALETREKVNEYLLNGNFNPLINYHQQGSAWLQSIPTPDHYLPLMYTLGVTSNRDEIVLFNDEVVMGSVSMTSVVVG